VRFVGTCYRAHDPRWAFKPLSGDGAAIRGARFNPKGIPALYLGLSIMTAIKEANLGFAHRIDPCVLCSYEIDCEDIADLTTEQGRREHAVERDDLNLVLWRWGPDLPIAPALITAGQFGCGMTGLAEPQGAVRRPSCCAVNCWLIERSARFAWLALPIA